MGQIDVGRSPSSNVLQDPTVSARSRPCAALTLLLRASNACGFKGPGLTDRALPQRPDSIKTSRHSLGRRWKKSLLRLSGSSSARDHLRPRPGADLSHEEVRASHGDVRLMLKQPSTRTYGAQTTQMQRGCSRRDRKRGTRRRPSPGERQRWSRSAEGKSQQRLGSGPKRAPSFEGDHEIAGTF